MRSVESAVATNMTEERKVVTVLFADVVGSTPLAGRLDPEDLRAQMVKFFAIAREEIEHFGGTIEKYIGDAVMAAFGLPAVHEDDPSRAVVAALAIRARLRPLVETGILPQIRVGINTGEVIANPKAADKGEFLVTGEVVNIAARLQQQAQPGQILVGDATHAATQWAFEFRPAGLLQVKGKNDRVEAFECLAIRTEPQPARGIPGIRAPLIGRDHEVAAVLSGFDRLSGGSGAIIGIIGDPGIGKTRLLTEVRRRLGDRPVTWLVGRTLSISHAISYWPFLEIIRGAAGITESDDPAQSWAKLTARVAMLLPDEVAEVAPYLGTMLGLEIPPLWRDRVQYLDGEAMGRQIYRSTRLFLDRLARERPLVVVFEDLHWIDRSSSELLEHLLPLVHQAPVLFIGISRPDPETPAQHLREMVLRDHAQRYTELSLMPLSATDSAELLGRLLEVDELPARLRQVVIERAEGNPFFVEEVIRALIDLGVIARGAEGWRFDEEIDSRAIPETLRGVIVARIDRLDEEVKQILKTAAVIGRTFFYRVLRAVTEAGVALDRDLDELQRLDLINERRRMPELEYTFKHALTQEAAYETILLRIRRDLHRRVATTIESLFSDRLEEFFGLLAYHYARAEDWEQAQAYLFRAGDQAVRLAADTEALAYYEQAVQAYARVFGDRWDPLQRAALERKMAEALYRRGDNQQALEYLQRSLGHLGNPFPASRAAIRAAIAGQFLRQIGHRALPWFFLRHPPDRPHPPAAEERARIYETMGWIDYFLNVDRLILEGLLLLNVSEEHGFNFGIARGAMGLGLIFDLVPAFRIAGFYHRRAVEVAEELRHPLALGLTYLGLALHEAHIGTFENALVHLQRAAAAYREAGELRQWGAAVSVEAWLRRLHGEFARCLALDHEMLRVGLETADPQLRGWGLTEVGNTLWMMGRTEEAIAPLTQARELFSAIPDDRWTVIAAGGLGMCHLRQDRLDLALDVLEEMHRIIVRRGFKGFLGFVPRGSLIEAYLLAADRASSSERAAWLERAGRLCREFRWQSTVDIEAVPAALRLTGTLDWLRGRQGRARSLWLRSVAMADRLGTRYDLGLSYLEIGRRTGEERFLQQAQAVFAEIGAEFDLKQTARLLRRAS